MEVSSREINEYAKRLVHARIRILANNGFYGLLLMHMKFSLDETCETVTTDGKRIFFSPAFLDALKDSELDFVLCHEILHVALRHCFRARGKDKNVFDCACDIVVNSNILYSENGNLSAITTRRYGVAAHTAPDGKEGACYTAEQVYAMLQASSFPKGTEPLSVGNHAGKKSKSVNEKSGKAKNGNKPDGSLSPNSSFPGKRGESRTPTAFGFLRDCFDDHSRWDTREDSKYLDDLWQKHVIDACQAITVRNGNHSRGTLPQFAERLWKQLKRPQTDWRMLLHHFICEEITDYSFMPPDRRFDDSPFFLPDFNEKEETVRNILFMVDTSGSMSDTEVSEAFDEINGAIEQFNGRLKGFLGFFDAEVVPPKPFENFEEFKGIRPIGGGGTDFAVIFDYIYKKMSSEMPSCVIILTDGYAPFPPESKARGLPVFWLINNEEITPPWGITARILSDV